MTQKKRKFYFAFFLESCCSSNSFLKAHTAHIAAPYNCSQHNQVASHELLTSFVFWSPDFGHKMPETCRNWFDVIQEIYIYYCCICWFHCSPKQTLLTYDTIHYGITPCPRLSCYLFPLPTCWWLPFTRPCLSQVCYQLHKFPLQIKSFFIVSLPRSHIRLNTAPLYFQLTYYFVTSSTIFLKNGTFTIYNDTILFHMQHSK
jgi:hypothetical protein